MNVIMSKMGRIIISPETEFEESVMRLLGRSLRAWHKSGITTGDYVGIVIEEDNVKEAKKIEEKD